MFLEYLENGGIVSAHSNDVSRVAFLSGKISAAPVRVTPAGKSNALAEYVTPIDGAPLR